MFICLFTWHFTVRQSNYPTPWREREREAKKTPHSQRQFQSIVYVRKARVRQELGSASETDRGRGQSKEATESHGVQYVNVFQVSRVPLSHSLSLPFRVSFPSHFFSLSLCLTFASSHWPVFDKVQVSLHFSFSLSYSL